MPSVQPIPTPSSCSKPAAPSACHGSITSKVSSRCGTPASAELRRSPTSSSATSTPPPSFRQASQKTNSSFPIPPFPASKVRHSRHQAARKKYSPSTSTTPREPKSVTNGSNPPTGSLSSPSVSVFPTPPTPTPASPSMTPTAPSTS